MEGKIVLNSYEIWTVLFSVSSESGILYQETEMCECFLDSYAVVK